MTDQIALIFSALALFVSAVSAFKTWRTNSRQSHYQERLVNLETTREQDRQRLARSADVRASIVHGERLFFDEIVPQHWLVIRNDGMALARKVRVLLDGKSLVAHKLVLDGEQTTAIGSGAEHRYTLKASLNSASFVDVLIQWDDDSGEPRRWESKLKIV